MSKQLSEAQIQAAIAELLQNRVKVTGTVVRSELRRRYGSPGGVARVYRLLQEIQTTNSSIDHRDLVAENMQLKTQLAAAQQRATVAEEREEAHQARWTMEVDSLRQQLREALVYRRQVGQLQDQLMGLRRQIHVLTVKDSSEI